MVSRACRGAPSDKEMVSRACRGAPSDKEMVSRACRGAPSDKEMVSRACRGAPSHEGNGVPSLSRGTFPRRKWCPELAEGHLPMFRPCSTATYCCVRTAHIMSASQIIWISASSDTTKAPLQTGPRGAALYHWFGPKSIRHCPQPACARIN